MKRFDKGVFVVGLSAALTLSGMSFVFCPTAHAGGPPPPTTATVAAAHAPTEASKTAMSLDPDEDGDELLEHWNSPKYSGEERFQLAGMLAAFTVAGAAMTFRRRTLQKASRHD